MQVIKTVVPTSFHCQVNNQDLYTTLWIAKVMAGWLFKGVLMAQLIFKTNCENTTRMVLGMALVNIGGK